MPRTSHGISILLHYLSTLLLAMDQTTVTYSSCQSEELSLLSIVILTPSLVPQPVQESVITPGCMWEESHWKLLTLLLELKQLSASVSLCFVSMLSVIYFPFLVGHSFTLQLSCYRLRHTLFFWKVTGLVESCFVVLYCWENSKFYLCRVRHLLMHIHEMWIIGLCD